MVEITPLVRVAVRLVRVVKMAFDHVIDVVVVDDRGMSAPRTMLVAGSVTFATMLGAAALSGVNVIVLHAPSNGREAAKISVI